jgi:hypothetical protein
MLQEAAELLCRASRSAAAGDQRTRTTTAEHNSRLLTGRLTLAQHRELLVTAGWLALLLGCVHYDLGERELTERYPDERLADDFHQRYHDARAALRRKAHSDT